MQHLTLLQLIIADWEKKFCNLGLVCTELTGDTDQAQLSNVRSGDLIVTTPEKWDSMTRRWQDHRKLLDMVRLFLVILSGFLYLRMQLLIMSAKD
jgi:replicative superfamily II helicase